MVITVINQKGGVGKSTVAAALAYGFEERGQRCLCIDLDPQGNLTYSLTGQLTADGNVLSIMDGSSKVNAKNIESVNEHIDIIPSSPMLAAVQPTSHELLLKALAVVRKKYDYIVIDTPPSLGLLTINALIATDCAVIPAIPDLYSIMGIAQLSKTLETVNRLRDTPVALGGIVITRYNARHRDKRESAAKIAEGAANMGTKVYATTIPESTVIGRIQSEGKSMYAVAPDNAAVKAFRAFVDEAFPR